MTTTTKKSLLLSLPLLSAALGETYLKETFSDPATLTSNWVSSSFKQSEGLAGDWEVSPPKTWAVDADIEQGLRTTQDARFYAISRPLTTPFSNRDQDLVLQFSVRNEGKQSSFCGGGYIKLLPKSTDLSTFGGDSEYAIMFGPDICGYDVSRIHLIFNHDGKNLLKKDDIKLEYKDKDDLTHLYTLVVKPDNTYKVLFDNEVRSEGSLLDNWDFPQKEIADPDDVKPEDWVDDEYIVDPDDVKPEGYDDIPRRIPDPSAKQPEDWDEEDDGEWEAPLISNPEYKGEWTPKKIKNPDYKGKWVQKKIPNKDYKDDVYAFDDIGAVGFELWIVNSGSIFDNIYVGNSEEEAKKLAEETFDVVSKDQKAKKAEHEDAKKAVEEEDEDEDEEEDEEVEIEDEVEVKEDL